MARLIPRIDTATIANGGERIVAEALRDQLPDSCTVYHSYPWLKLARNDFGNKECLQPGEADFIVVDPECGLLVVEVKGGTVEYDAGRHEFVRVHERGGRERIRSPWDQAARNLYAVRDMILAHESMSGTRALPFAHGYAVAFPHCRYSGALPPDATPEVVFSADDIGTLGDRVRNALNVWSRTPRARPVSAELCDVIQESLSPVFRLTPVLWRTLEEQDKRLNRLTEDQERILSMLSRQPRAAIEGVAGSGKTILAMSQAQRFARQGMKTLLLCFNRPLADWLDQQLPTRYRDRVTIDTFHRLCATYCRTARIPFAGTAGDADFWSYTAPDLLEQACNSLDAEQKFDAIVVDEGQDFHELWWSSLRKVQRSDDPAFPMYVFFDPKQNLYVHHPTLPPRLAGPFLLPTNCRNTRMIARACGEIIHETIDVHADAPEGAVPKIVFADSVSAVVSRACEQVREWCLPELGNLSRNRIAILTPTEPAEEWPANIGDISLTGSFDEWRAGKGILLSTCRRFKGLEADALILAGIPKPDTKKYFKSADYYVAASRAKHLLTVIATESL